MGVRCIIILLINFQLKNLQYNNLYMTPKNNLILYAVIATTFVVAGVSVFTLNNKITDLDKTVQNSNSSSGINANSNNNPANQLNTTNLAVQDLSLDEQNALVYMREEEKLARDVYQTLGQTYNLQVFKNIANSEQKHMDQVEQLLDKYNLADPIINNGVSQFTNPDLASLYTQLIEKGSQSQIEALKVGATIEDLDIKDLTENLGKTNNPDIIQVFTNLRSGSYNHLRAFTNNLKKTGDSYTPQYISQSEYEKILASSNIQGGQGKGNQGGGNGKGKNN